MPHNVSHNLCDTQVLDKIGKNLLELFFCSKISGKMRKIDLENMTFNTIT